MTHHIPGGQTGREPCDCRRQLHARMPDELGGQWVCVNCGSAFRETATVGLWQRIKAMARRYDVEIVCGVLPVLAVLAVLAVEAVAR